MVWAYGKKDEYRVARRVLMAEVSGGRVRGRLRLGWMDGVKVALGNRGMMVEAVRQCAKHRKEWSPGTCVTECVSRGRFCSTLCSFGLPSRAPEVTTWRGVGCRYMMRLG